VKPLGVACAELAQWGRPWCSYRTPLGCGERKAAPHKKLSLSLRREERVATGYPEGEAQVLFVRQKKKKKRRILLIFYSGFAHYLCYSLCNNADRG
jgi:hypothetical protein